MGTRATGAKGAITIGVIGTLVVMSVASRGLGDRRSERTADMPDSWLVLYNLNDPGSIAWANWYKAERGIPQENLLGLEASTDEHMLSLGDVQRHVVGPVRTYLEENPELSDKIMGIILGYGLPGHYHTPPLGGPGGFSVADALEHEIDDTLPPPDQQGYNLYDNPQFLGYMLPPDGRLTKATMDSRRFMVARIDGPTLADAKALTERAKAIEDPSHYLYGEYVYYDYTDSLLPSDTWQWLKFGVEEPELAEVPWTEFDADTEQTPNDAMRFGTHDVDGWNDSRLYHPDGGSRILAFNYNSWGATTVRSVDDDGGRFVPNALAAGYAAAIGSTGEPTCCLGPIPETILAGLREGWTLGESFHISSVWDDWMWTLVGDPFLTIPHWFDEPQPSESGDGDMNQDGDVNGLDLQLFAEVFTGVEEDPALIAIADLDGSGDLDDDDLFLFMGPALYDTYDPNVLRGSGDANGDGPVNGADIPVFIDRLLNGFQGDETLRILFAPDMNKDGEVTFEDVPLFVDALLH